MTPIELYKNSSTSLDESNCSNLINITEIAIENNNNKPVYEDLLENIGKFTKDIVDKLTKEDEILVIDTPASRKKYTKMGFIMPLPKHLKKLIKDMEKKEKEFEKYGVKVKNVVVPGLEWMADL